MRDRSFRCRAVAATNTVAQALHEWFERSKAQARAIVEHPFHIIKNLFGYRKVSYCALPRTGPTPKTRRRLSTYTSLGAD